MESNNSEHDSGSRNCDYSKHGTNESRRRDDKRDERRRSRSPRSSTDHRKKDYRSNERDNDRFGSARNNDRHHDKRHSDWNRRGRRNDNNDGRPSWENNKVRQHAEKIQQRKLLWGKAGQDSGDNTAETSSAEPTEAASNSVSSAPNASTTVNAWTSRLAAATSDTKQIDKFQRLMGMKKAGGNVAAVPTAEEAPTAGIDKRSLEAERKKQEELTAQLDRQYAMARATTHLGRGKGLGFSG